MRDNIIEHERLSVLIEENSPEQSFLPDEEEDAYIRMKSSKQISCFRNRREHAYLEELHEHKRSKWEIRRSK